MRKALVLTTLLAALAVAPSPDAAATASRTVTLLIQHVYAHCHVWRSGAKALGAQAKLTLKRGDRLQLRSDCPMDFDYKQTAGPKLKNPSWRSFAGETRTLAFSKPGVYRFKATNVQTPQERNLDTAGPTNMLSLTVVVR